MDARCLVHGGGGQVSPKADSPRKLLVHCLTLIKISFLSRPHVLSRSHSIFLQELSEILATSFTIYFELDIKVIQMFDIKTERLSQNRQICQTGKAQSSLKILYVGIKKHCKFFSNNNHYADSR